jgi:hypothetical protein
LNRDAAVFARVFPGDTLRPIVAAIRTVAPEGKPFVARAPVPSDSRGAIVEVVLRDPSAKKEDDRSRGRAMFGGSMLAASSVTLPIVRAWTSAHASAITHKPSLSTQADGETDDPRVGAWAATMIPLLTADSLVDRMTIALAAHTDAMFPLTEYFSRSSILQTSHSSTRNGGSGSSIAPRL